MNEVKFRALLEGDAQVIAAARRIESAMNRLEAYQNTKFQMNVDLVNLDRAKQKFQELYKTAKNQRAELHISSPELDKVDAKLKEVNSELDRLNSKRSNLTTRSNALGKYAAEENRLYKNEWDQVKAGSYTRQISDWHKYQKDQATRTKSILDNELKTTKATIKSNEALAKSFEQQKSAIVQNSPQYKKLTSDMEHYQNQIDNITASQKALKTSIKEQGLYEKSASKDVAAAKANMRELEQQMAQARQNILNFASSVEGAFSTVGGAISRVGGVMQTLGNTFGGRAVNTIKTMGTAFATMGLYSAAQGTVSRYDTMRMFPKQMGLLGFSATKAEGAVNKLEQAVIGLPTGLDEIVESARQLVTLTGNLDRGTDLAIATNNAFLAGGGDAHQILWGQRQIRDLLSTGKLRSQEWESLIKALGPGLRYIGEAMGYADFGKFRSELKENNIEANKFLDTLIKLGTNGGILSQIADIQKDTLSATAKNIKNAIQNLGATGLDAIGDILLKNTGKDLPATIKDISDAIKNNLKPALSTWASRNSNQIMDFFDRLKNYDWLDLVSRVGKGLAKYYDMMTTLFTKMNPKFIAFMSVWGGPVGRMMSAVGGGITALGGIAGTLIRHFGLGGKGRAVTAAATAAADTAGAVGRIGINLKSSFGRIGLVAGSLGTVALAGLVIAEYGKIIEYISKLNISSNFDANMVKVGGAFASVTGLMTILTHVFEGGGWAAAGGEALTAGLLALVGFAGRIIADFGTLVEDIANIDAPWDKFKDNSLKIAAAMGGFSSVIFAIGALNTAMLPFVVTGNLSLRSVAKTVRSFVPVLNEIARVQTPDSAKIHKVFSAINEMGDQVIANGGLVRWARAWTGSKTLKNVQKGISSVSEVLVSVLGMQSTLQKMTGKGRFGVSSGILDMNQIIDSVTTVVDGVTNMMHLIDQRETMFSAWTQKHQTGNIAKATDSISNVLDSFLNMQNTLGQLVQKGKYGYNWIATRRQGDNPFWVGIENILDIIEDTVDLIDRRNTWLGTAFKKWQVGNISKAADYISDIVNTFSLLQTTLGGLMQKGKFGYSYILNQPTNENPFTKSITRIIDITENLIDLIDNRNTWLGAKLKKLQVKNISDATNYISDIVDTFATLQTTLGGLMHKGKFGYNYILQKSGKGNPFWESLSSITNIINDVISLIDEKNTTLTSKWKKNQTNNFADAAGYINDTLTAFSTIQTTLGDMVKAGRFGTHPSGREGLDLSLITGFVKDIVSNVNTLLDEIDIKVDPTKAGNLSTLNESMTSIRGIVTDLSNMQEDITGLVPDEEFTIGTKLQAIMTSLDAAFGGTATVDFGNLKENISQMNSAVSMLAGAEGIVAQLKSVETSLGNLTMDGNNFWTPGLKLAGVLGTLQGAFSSQGSANAPFNVNPFGGLQNVASYLGAVNTALQNIESSAQGAASQLEAASKGLDKLGKSAETHKGSIEDAATAASKLKSGVKGIGGFATMAATGVDTLGSSASNQAGNIQAAATAAQNLASAISSIPDNKSVNVSVNGSSTGGTLSSGFSSVIDKVKSYFGHANGGAIRGRGGIDNIPAWLTNGEFVMRKSAHQAFGTAFMNRINNLDVDGALKALSIRAGVGVGRRANVTNNYTRDNHANVTFNVNRATQGYSQRRASRWARALS